ncbi:hypothetical protein FHS18_003652 [Paenibacillus phyllosphaerae]|uniref:Uncharacterized protein n=1 Tax=Paenibacillus phyllosphaerae TaxID=274593 RepID=A0A7W5FP14_9BACL|nr:hypothetical protein [Paenibacillus phyllosphaerae]MBB3111584.1 hypothetical protein [Paenibacillus phyllosphaerae]
MSKRNSNIDDQTAVDTAGLPIFPYREDISATDMIDPIVEGVMTNIQMAFTGESDSEPEKDGEDENP